MAGIRSNCPNGVYTDLSKYESRLRIYWTERATKKNGRIIGEGYAERQIRKTLDMVEKIDTRI